MIKKISIISINSPEELTGGGHYLRCLIKGYERINSNVLVVGKDIGVSNFNFGPNVIFKLLQKNLFSDFLSRFFLNPSFLMRYFFDIKKSIADSDVIAFHSSRLGILIYLISRVYPKKKIFCHFDNVEYLLVRERLINSKFSFRYILNFFDFFLIKFSEKLCIKYSDGCSFITKSDAEYFLEGEHIIPICYDALDSVGYSHKDYYLFTASFDFEPNIDALREFKLIAKENPKIKFVASGRKLGQFSNDNLHNLEFIDSPSVYQMESIFSHAKGYISCVNFGSGMKTKVAEAMRYGLTVYATDNSLVGYEDVLGKPYINRYSNIEELSVFLSLGNGDDINREYIVNDFKKYFSIERVKVELEKLIK